MRGDSRPPATQLALFVMPPPRDRDGRDERRTRREPSRAISEARDNRRRDKGTRREESRPKRIKQERQPSAQYYSRL